MSDSAWRQTTKDPSTYANTQDLVVKHMTFDWRADFDLKELQGSVVLKADVLQKTDKIVLDTRDLRIHSVSVNGASSKFELGDSSAAFGAALTISPPSPLEPGTAATIEITYQTSPSCTALCWLPKEQTDGCTQPYLFSQCQAIHARSLFPCQDTPGVKSTYSATVTAPKALRVLMSALIKEDKEEGESRIVSFNQPVPIPSYLLAIVVGDLKKVDISDRVAIWSEPSVVDRAAFDFSETDQFVKTGEELVGPYEWTRYDVVCLPGSFPYGGMENPCLTFVTPSLLTGDKSLADVICHEVSHSWTGNLVSPQTWEDFYLNEGFTMFLQRKIMSRIHGKDYFDFDAICGWDVLKKSVDLFGPEHPYTCLRPNLNNVDPDDAFSSVPYEKGFNLVCHLQNVVGDEEAFEKWLFDYIQTFKNQSITSNEMVNHLVTYFSKDGRHVDFSSVNWKAWFDQPGMPPVIPDFKSDLIDQCVTLAEKWTSGSSSFAADDIKGWTTGQICYFLVRVPHEKLTPDLLTEMDRVYKFNSSTNSEILFLWLQKCIKVGWTGHEEVLKSFLRRIGRMKFTRPLYRDLKSQDPEFAKALFLENKHRYHSICQKMVGSDLGIEQ
eukprot:TRINITY_DN904_c0_g3_i2.p1 TRINITY_DN904_c0_g3~~TRINITY_DN904_c0_g3_i2.p1  ORF type:complete len:609 (+),score=114.88 TRINITY_DN904_c0_g3_i2:78-1904(+)